MTVDVALFFHICGVLALFGAALVETMSLLMLKRTSTVTIGRAWASLNKPLEAVFPISAVLLIVTGLYMVRTSDEFKGATQPWAMTVLALLVVLSIVGAAFNGQRTKAIRLGLNAAPEGSIPVDLEARIHDPALLTSILSMTSGILGAVMLMTIKPSSAVTCIIIAAAWLLAGALVAQPLTRSRPILAARGTEMTGSDSPI
jgi:hypothetical protein